MGGEHKHNPIQYEEQKTRHLTAVWGLIVLTVSVLLSFYHFYTAGFGLMHGVGSRMHLLIHLTGGLCLIFLLCPAYKKDRATSVPWYDALLALLAVIVGGYVMLNLQSPSILGARMTTVDLIFGILLILIVLEATRRVVGYALVIIAGLFIAYFFLGGYLPYPFLHSRADFERFIYEMAYTTSGIFGTPLSVSANYVFIFILFGAILETTGAGKLFIDLSLRAFGKYKGGPAKAAVISSGMLGSISGSSTANAVTTGTFTIPLMKKVGFKPQIAGGIEVAASSSGQFLPPIMGAAAFLMIEYTGHPYVEIIRSALIPALLSYVAILLMVHFEASRHGIRGLRREELASARKLIVQQGYLILPIFVLIYFLVAGNTVGNAAFFSVVILLVIAFCAHRFKERMGSGLLIALLLSAITFGLHYLLDWKIEIAAMIVLGAAIALLFALMQKVYRVESAPVRFGLRELIHGFQLAARNALSVIVACATAGILIGVVNITGLSSKLPLIIVGYSADLAEMFPAFLAAHAEQIQLYLALILTVIACLIMGLGLPTTATYVILAAMVAPALVQMGLPVLAAHLFVLYYGVLADDTPPINLPAYAAAGIAKADPVKTGVQGFKFDSGALLLPFAFATNPNLLLLNPDATWYEIATNIITALIGIIAFASFIQRWLLIRYTWWERWIALLSALVLIHGSMLTDVIGIMLLAVLLVTQYLRKNRTVQHDIPA